MNAHILIRFAAAAALLAQSAATSALAAGASPPATAVHTFKPSVPSGRPVSGNCWTNSIASNREDAYRCMTGNSIADPCFTTKRPSIVVCDADPVAGKPGFAMRLTKPLPAAMPSQGAIMPWLIELSDGTACSPFTGTRPVLGKLIVAYGCTSSKSQATGTDAGLADTLDTATPTWHAERVVYRVGTSGLAIVSRARVPIKAAWK